jgi:nucleoside transporter
MSPPLLIRPRIAALLFFQLFSAGSWIVTLGYYMSHTLKFGHIVGAAYGMLGVAAVMSSLFSGMLADHYFSTEKLVGSLYLGASVALITLVSVHHTPFTFLVNMFVLATCVAAASPLVTALVMSMLENPVRQFPAFRAFGTGGWIVAGLAVGLWPGAAATPAPMQLAALSYLITGLYCFSMPNVPPAHKGKDLNIVSALGIDILRKGTDKTLLIFFASILTVAIPMKFYDSLFNTFLSEKGMTLNVMGITLEPTGIQTMGQLVEMATLVLLAPLIARLGFKRVMIIGMVAWVGRYLLFAYGFDGDQAIKWRLMLGILMHGLSYDFFFVTGQVWLEKSLGPSMRNRAQSLCNFINNGAGVIIGSNIAGFIFTEFNSQSAGINWWAIWLVPAIFTTLTLTHFVLKFTDRVPATSPSIKDN